MTNRNGTLDALRILACAMVVTFHYGHHYGLTEGGPITFGWIGVPLFFMISGYVISASLEERSPLAFLWARWVRLWSTYLPSMLITAMVVSAGLAMGYGGHLEEEMRFNRIDFLASLTMLTHLFKLVANANPIDGAYWSLGVEIQFYLMIALWTRIMGRGKEIAFMAVWLVVAAVYACRPFWIGEVVFALKWAPFFCLGMSLHLLRTDRIWESFKGLVGVMVLACGVLVLTVAVGGDGKKDALRLALILPVFSGLMGLAVNIPDLIRGKLVSYLALLTYPMYLIHQNVGYVVMNALKDDYSEPMRVAAAVMISLGLSMIALSAGNLIAKGMKCISFKRATPSDTSVRLSA